jgi:hypothetical protein
MQTKDGLLEVIKVANLSNVIFAPADWSVVNLPTEAPQTAQLANLLYNTPVSNHVSLVLCRHSRKNRVQSMATIGHFDGKWKYLDNITVLYEKPNSGSNNGLLPVSEHAYLFYKGEVPNTKATSWFRAEDGHANATNHWDVGLQPGEEDGAYYQGFSWELNLLLKSMCGFLEHRCFIHAVETHADELISIYKFCEKYIIKGKVYIADDIEYRKATELLSKIVK